MAAEIIKNNLIKCLLLFIKTIYSKLLFFSLKNVKQDEKF